MSLDDSKSKLVEFLSASNFIENRKKFYQEKYYYGEGGIFRYLKTDEYLLTFHIAFLLAAKNINFDNFQKALRKHIWEDVFSIFGLTLEEYEKYFEEFIISDFAVNWTGYYQNYSGSPWIADMEGLNPHKWAYVDYMCPSVCILGGKKIQKKPLPITRFLMYLLLSLSLVSFYVIASLNEFTSKSFFISAAVVYVLTMFIIMVTVYDKVPTWRHKGINRAILPMILALGSIVSIGYNYIICPYKLGDSDILFVLLFCVESLLISSVLWIKRKEVSVCCTKHSIKQKTDW